nr:MAG: putative RNA-dependent RNA polymerase [Picobirnavirus sp.]
MRTPIPQQFIEIISGNNGLKLYLDSLLENRDFTTRSWLYSGKKGSTYVKANKVLKDWLARLSVLKDGSEFEKKVYQFDISQIEKYGPQGGHAPVEDLLDDIVMPSFNPPQWSRKPAAFTTKAWKWAIEMVISELRNAGVHDLYPRSYKHVVDDMRARDTLISNSGWPDFTTRSKPEVVAKAISDAQDGSWRQYPAILLFRRYNGKTRQVWMFPMATNIVEGSWFQPLTDAIMKSSLADYFFSPWKGFDTVRSRVSDVYRLEDQCYIAASDFSSTDAHFQLAASEEVLKVLTALFKPQYKKELEESVRHMHTIPLLIGPKDMLTGKHGVASGSNWTNFIETIFDMIFGYYVQYEISNMDESFWVTPEYAIGDDMAWKVERDGNDAIPLEVMAKQFPQELERLGRSAGQQIKAEKTMSEIDEVKSLQRLFQRGYTVPDSDEVRAVYSTVRALKSSIYPERAHYQDWDLDMFAARQFMILENCVDHPLFEEFVAFICKGNPYLIPFAKKSDSKLDGITRKSKRIPGLNPTYNQEKRDTGLSQFASIRIARGL